MITVAQAKKLRGGDVIYAIGDYDSQGRAVKWRVNGSVQTWKTRPEDFKVPLKHGLRDYAYLTPQNAHLLTLKEPAPRTATKKAAKKKAPAKRTPRPYYPEYGIR